MLAQHVTERTACVSSVCYKAELFSLTCQAHERVSQNSSYMPLKLPGGHGSRRQTSVRFLRCSLFLRCDAAGSASCFIDSYLTLSHAPL